MFELGQTVATSRIKADMQDPIFGREIMMCLNRYQNCDWGDTSEDDKPLNDEAVETGDRILAAYETTKGRIWIITEQDRTVTTVLYPDEY